MSYAEIDSAGKAERIGAAVAFDRDAVEPEERAAVEAARIHLFLQNAEAAGAQAMRRAATAIDRRIAARRYSLICVRGALGGLERDIAGKALDDHDIDHTLPDLVALDEAAIVERQIGAL